MELIADFEADWAERMRLRLSEWGFKVPAGFTGDKLSCTYWNVVWRTVPVQPRAVLKAKEFVCPPQHEAGLAALVERFGRGEDVNPWRSTTRTIGKFNDKLLNDWGIQHFHLGLTPQERFDDCLFAKVVANAVFFLHVLPHDCYTERDLVRRIHGNWPEVIQQFRAVDLKGNYLDDEQTKTLRRKNYTVALTMPDGAVYFPPGGGLMSNGLAFGVRRNADLATDTVRYYRQWVEKNLDSIAEDCRRHERPIESPAIFKMVVEDGHIASAIEVNARAKIKLGPLLPKSDRTPFSITDP